MQNICSEPLWSRRNSGISELPAFLRKFRSFSVHFSRCKDSLARPRFRKRRVIIGIILGALSPSTGKFDCPNTTLNGWEMYELVLSNTTHAKQTVLFWIPLCYFVAAGRPICYRVLAHRLLAYAGEYLARRRFRQPNFSKRGRGCCLSRSYF